MRVLVEGVGIFGALEDQTEGFEDGDAPLVRVTGRAAFGGVEVMKREIGEKKGRKRLRHRRHRHR